jgi:branched-chain amino acid transport system substrate-binding protein
MDDHSIDGARRHFVKLAAGGALVVASPMFVRIANAAGTRALKIGWRSRSLHHRTDADRA